MATTTDIRDWLRDNGHEVGDRGRLTAEQRDLYDQAHPPEPEDMGVTEADFTGLDTEPDVPMEAERPPKRVRARPPRPAGQTRSDRFVGRLLGDGKPKPKGKTAKKHPRVPVDHLVTRVWEGLGRMAGMVSMPVSRCLQVQSPVAGMILEDVVRDTVVDRALQPVARAEEKGEKILALVAPPLLVALIEQSAALPPQQAAVRQAFLVPMLKESLRVWLTVAGPKVEEAAHREAEYQERFGRTIDELMELFFQSPGPVQAEATVREPEPAMA
jgi:hypothetical protein